MTSIFSKLNSNSLALVLSPIIFIPLVFYNTTFAMMRVWMVNETFTHGFLVMPLAIWLIWRKKSQILLLKPSPEPGVFLVLILLLICWLISAAVGVEIAQQFFMVTIIIITIWIAAGRQVVLNALFPLMFLYFLVPFGQVFIPPLMQYTANFTVALIKLVGVPVYQDGLSFVLPTGSWSVVEECSGVRYLIASFFLGSIYAYLNYSSTKKRVIFILLSLMLPIVGNGLRAFGIVMIGHYSGMKLAVGADHLLYGWVFFGLIIFLLFYAGSFWRDPEGSLEGVNDEHSNSSGSRANYFPSGTLLITFLLMMTTLLFSNYIKNAKQGEINPVSFQLPVHFSGWQYDADRSLNWQPVFLNPDTNISRGYFFEEDFIQLNIAYYQTQRQGAEAISTSNKITSPYGGEWKLISTTEIFEGDKYFTESELKRSDQKLLVWSWYRIGRYETPNPYMAKIFEAYNLIIEGRSDASIVSIAAQFNDSKKITRQKIYDFWKKSSNDIANNFEKIRDEK